jgi:hypothetical protein
MDDNNSGRLTAPQILAITVPICSALTSIVWAVATYLMVREKYRAQAEQAVWGRKHKKHHE